jgi:lysine N6-hydroxylase
MTLDVAAVGCGPFNLALAALADGVPGLELAVFEQRPRFAWHPGLLIEGTTLQVPFLADLVTLVDPTSRWSFLNYLREHGRLFPFYLAERFHVPRAEYDAYCRWVAHGLGGCHFGQAIDDVRWDGERALFLLNGEIAARHVVIGVGTEPWLPPALRELPSVVHSADYLDHRDALVAAPSVTVVGSGQSGAEVFLDLLRRRDRQSRGGLRWIARTPAFAPMEYSKLGLEQFTPDHTAYFHGLPPDVRDALLPTQWQLYKAVSGETLARIHDELYERSLDGWPDTVLQPGVEVIDASAADGHGVELTLRHLHQGTTARITTAAVVAATGYAQRPLDRVLGPLVTQLRTDQRGRPLVGADYRLDLGPAVTGSVFVQNAELHSHGVGAPDLGLAAWRAAVIVNEIVKRLRGAEAYPLPKRTAFTTFGLGEDT